MKTFAMIQNGLVINIAVWDGISLWNPGAQYTLQDITNLKPQPGIGWSYDGNNFSAPAAPAIADDPIADLQAEITSQEAQIVQIAQEANVPVNPQAQQAKLQS